MQWRYTFGDDGADVAALAGTRQIYAASLNPVGDGEVFVRLDVGVQALPIEGLEGECTCMRHNSGVSGRCTTTPGVAQHSMGRQALQQAVDQQASESWPCCAGYAVAMQCGYEVRL